MEDRRDAVVVDPRVAVYEQVAEAGHGLERADEVTLEQAFLAEDGEGIGEGLRGAQALRGDDVLGGVDAGLDRDEQPVLHGGQPVGISGQLAGGQAGQATQVA